MSLIRHLLRIAGQLVAHAWRARRPGLLLLVVLGFVAVVLGLAVQVVTPVAIYPFL